MNTALRTQTFITQIYSLAHATLLAQVGFSANSQICMHIFRSVAISAVVAR